MGTHPVHVLVTRLSRTRCSATRYEVDGPRVTELLLSPAEVGHPMLFGVKNPSTASFEGNPPVKLVMVDAHDQ